MIWLYVIVGLLILWLFWQWLHIRGLQREGWNAIRLVLKRRGKGHTP